MDEQGLLRESHDALAVGVTGDAGDVLCVDYNGTGVEVEAPEESGDEGGFPADGG